MNREKFPLLKNVVYLDSAAAGLKPLEVVKSVSDFYLEYPINSHSGDSRLGVLVAQKISEARDLVASLVKASSEEVIFTSGTTDSLNKIANMLQSKLSAGDEILLSYLNHSSNIIPWMEIVKKTNAKIIFSANIINDISDKTKIIAFAQTNNTLDIQMDMKAIKAKAESVKAIVVNDAAQAIVHEEVSLSEADVIVFSGNKLYGPTGIGALVIKQELLNTLKPVTFGGGAVAEITTSSWIGKDSYYKYEPGTQHAAGILGLGAAIKYLNSLGLEAKKHEVDVANYAFDQLTELEDIEIYSKRGDLIIMFNLGKYSPQDVVSYLGHKDIILRAGEHCARLGSEITDFSASIRVSIAHYNTNEDIDKMIKAIKNGGDFLDFV